MTQRISQIIEDLDDRHLWRLRELYFVKLSCQSHKTLWCESHDNKGAAPWNTLERMGLVETNERVDAQLLPVVREFKNGRGETVTVTLGKIKKPKTIKGETLYRLTKLGAQTAKAVGPGRYRPPPKINPGGKKLIAAIDSYRKNGTSRGALRLTSKRRREQARALYEDGYHLEACKLEDEAEWFDVIAPALWEVP